MECCCYVWAGVRKCYLDMLDKLQKKVRKTVGSTLGAFVKLLDYHGNVVTVSPFYWCYFDRCQSQLTELVPLYSLVEITNL